MIIQLGTGAGKFSWKISTQLKFIWNYLLLLFFALLFTSFSSRERILIAYSLMNINWRKTRGKVITVNCCRFCLSMFLLFTESSFYICFGWEIYWDHFCEKQVVATKHSETNLFVFYFLHVLGFFVLFCFALFASLLVFLHILYSDLIPANDTSNVCLKCVHVLITYLPFALIKRWRFIFSTWLTSRKINSPKHWHDYLRLCRCNVQLLNWSRL